MELLQFIYQNTKMGEDNLRALLPKVKDTNLKSHLHKQLTGYSSLNNKAEEEIYKRSGSPKENGTIAKLSSKMGVTMNTMIDNTPSHIAEMMIQGSTMGIVDMTKRMGQFKDTDHKTKALADEVLHFEQENIERLKSYL